MAPQGGPGPLPTVAPPDGVVVVPQGPNGPPGQWIMVGPRTRAHVARVLEQSLAPVWVALLETSGVPEGRGWRLVVDGCHLEPEPPPGGGRRKPDVGEDPALPAPLPDHSGQPSAPNGRWCPYCGADLSHIPVREDPPEDAVFAAVGRRLKTALAVGFVLVWMGVSLYDWLSEPEALVVPAWFSALGAFLLLVVLLGIQPWGWLGGRRR